MLAARVQLIRISPDRVVVRRGVHELLFEGPDVAALAEQLIGLADGTRSAREVVEAFAAPLQPDVLRILTELTRRRMMDEHDAPRTDDGDEAAAAFFWNFGPHSAAAPDALAAAHVLVVGVNCIAVALAQALIETGVGTVTLVHHGVLDHRSPTVACRLEIATEGRNVRRLANLPSDAELEAYTLIVAASDFGEADALLDVNRTALAAGRPYLPVWFANLIGYVGPLNVPFETPCFRCLRLRRDANDPGYEVSRAVRRHVNAAANGATSTRTACGPGLLAPMGCILGEVAALEVVKYVARFAPADTIGHLVELNLVSFRSAVRRLLKVPRCPECSDLTARSAKAITIGPKLPAGEWMGARG